MKKLDSYPTISLDTIIWKVFMAGDSALDAVPAINVRCKSERDHLNVLDAIEGRGVFELYPGFSDRASA